MSRLLSLLTVAFALLAGLVSAAPAVAAPVALTLEPESVTSTSATIRGLVNGESDGTGAASSVEFYFQFGPTTAYENAPTGTRSSAGNETVSEAITGLAPGTAYHYRVVAVKNGVQTLGRDGTFTTLPPPDGDHDGIPDAQDPCPTVAAGGTGCPPPPDRDGDGVPDAGDQCPDQRDDALTGYEGPNGCPEPDGDGDRVPDRVDRCPTVSYPNAMSGCPPDGDADGVTDFSDSCPGDTAMGTTDGCFHGRTAVRVDTPVIDGIRVTLRATFTSNFAHAIVSFQLSTSPDFDHFESAGCGSFSCQRTASCREDTTAPAGAPAQATCTIVGDGGYKKLVATRPLYIRASVNDSDTSGQMSDTLIYGTGSGDQSGNGEADGGGPVVAPVTLREALVPKGIAARIGAILRTGSSKAVLTATGAGRVTIEWTAKGTATRAAAAKLVRVAYGVRTVTSAGRTVVTVRLTKAGRALLKRSGKTLKLTAVGSFTPTGGTKKTTRRTITLKR